MELKKVILLALAALIVCVVLFSPSSPVRLSGTVVQFSELTSASSAITVAGQLVLARADNNGTFLLLTNRGFEDGYCGLQNASSGLITDGFIISSATSTLGHNHYEVRGYKGDVFCIVDAATTTISAIYTL